MPRNSKAAPARGATDGERLPAGTPTPAVTASASSFGSLRTDVAVCFAYLNETKPLLPGVPATSRLARTLTRLMRTESFRGKRSETVSWYTGGQQAAGRYVIVGLGKKGDSALDALRVGAASAARLAAGVGAKKMAVLLPPLGDGKTSVAAEAVTEGIAMGAYRMTKYQTGDQPGRLGKAEVIVGRLALQEGREGVARGVVRGNATNLTRDLVNEPAMVMTPTRMAEVARRIARENKLEIEVFDKKALRSMGMGAILGVAAGSDQPPCLIHLTYKPRGRAARKVALVGKGITFDSGGLSIKTAAGMETMKLDKAGATAVLGAMSAIPGMKPDVEVHGIMAMTENMSGGSAIKPGDVLRTMGGKTIEVLNTDAEGRLILADALAYAQKLKVDEIVDLATLTGACMVALGPSATGVFGNNQEMIDRFLACAGRAGEKMWQMPMYEEYSEHLRSDIADVKNTAGRYGGAITAALFLKTFVDDSVPWIHLDIAGPAFFDRDAEGMRKGATGAGVRTLLTYIQSLSG